MGLDPEGGPAHVHQSALGALARTDVRASLEVHQACVEPLVGGGELRQHGGAMRVESNAFDADTREEADAGQVEAPEADDHRERVREPHRDTRIARARVAISVSPMAANACAAPSMPSCERSLRA